MRHTMPYDPPVTTWRQGQAIVAGGRMAARSVVLAFYLGIPFFHETSWPYMTSNASFLSRIRGVDLLPCERVAAMLSPDEGLVAEPLRNGRLLVATDRRFIDLADSGDSQIRQIFAITSVYGTSVPQRCAAGVFVEAMDFADRRRAVVYVALAYWLVDRLPQIIIPGLNLHVFALIVMILVILAGWLFWRGFTQPGGMTIHVHGANWDVEAQCTSQYRDLMEFANALSSMQTQRQRWPYSGVRAERE